MSEMCKQCPNPILVMCQLGTGYCSQDCQRQAGALPGQQNSAEISLLQKQLARLLVAERT